MISRRKQRNSSHRKGTAPGKRPRRSAARAPAPRDKLPEAGDVFAVQLDDGRYGAVRVIRTSGKSSLVCTTTYLDRKRPALDDPHLRRVVRRRRFFFRMEPAIRWLDGPPPSNFKHIGHLAPSRTETSFNCSTYGGHWDEQAGDDAYLEWRWVHDRAAFEREVALQEAELDRRTQSPQKPKKMMGEAAFWAIIHLLDWKRAVNPDLVLRPAVLALAQKTTAEIRQFAERLAHLLYRMDTKQHAKHIGTYSYDGETDYVSADVFLYARCAAVAKGKSFYARALRDPAMMPKDETFEPLLILAAMAYRKKTGEEFDHDTGCSYETFSNLRGWR